MKHQDYKPVLKAMKSFTGQGAAATVTAQVKRDVKVTQGFVGQGTAAIIQPMRNPKCQ